MNNLYQIDKIDKTDYNRGFLQLLEQLTVVEPEKITYDAFCKRLDESKSQTYVIRDVSEDRVVATASVFIEKKFIRNLGSVAHIEDVVVDEKARGYGLGRSLIDHIVTEAKKEGCYKVTLNCSATNVPFYEKSGFKQKEVQMVNYL